MTSLADALTGIEARRNSRVLLLAASNLEIELLPVLFDVIRGLGDQPRLDVLLYGSGGEPGAARRIGLLLQQSTARLGVIVPDRCRSAATMVTLAAHEIVAGPAAIFSPVDPLLQASSGDEAGGPQAISAEDIRRFGEMAQAWFGQNQPRADSIALEALTTAIFPPTLTAFYRTFLETEVICRELLTAHIQDSDRIDAIVSQLMSGYHSHGFPLSREDLREAGLPVAGDAVVEELAWNAAILLGNSIGSGVRDNPDQDWLDACVATRDFCRVRVAGPRSLMPRWRYGTTVGDRIQSDSAS
jgi:hypothetical protein